LITKEQALKKLAESLKIREQTMETREKLFEERMNGVTSNVNHRKQKLQIIEEELQRQEINRRERLSEISGLPNHDNGKVSEYLGIPETSPESNLNATNVLNRTSKKQVYTLPFTNKKSTLTESQARTLLAGLKLDRRAAEQKLERLTTFTSLVDKKLFSAKDLVLLSDVTQKLKDLKRELEQVKQNGESLDELLLDKGMLDELMQQLQQQQQTQAKLDNTFQEQYEIIKQLQSIR